MKLRPKLSVLYFPNERGFSVFTRCRRDASRLGVCEDLAEVYDEFRYVKLLLALIVIYVYEMNFN
jgi:hypothetical protein